MVESLFSASWYRVKDLTPSLRSHAHIYRHRYRGEVWYVLRDAANERALRFSRAAHFTLGLMDGRRRVEEIWQRALEELGDAAPTQDEFIRLLGQLHASDVLQCDVTPDVREVFQRGARHERKLLQGKLMSPFAIRIPIADPERFLAATVDWVRPLFSWFGLGLWLAVVVPAMVQVGIHWDELTENVLDHMLAPQNLVLIWLIFPVLKLLHEFGHGYAAKVFGGEVHEMGIMLLVFTPVPCVDASSSWAFDSKYRRALVGAGGMVVELFIASLAFYVWQAAEAGTVRTLAYNIIIVGGISTLLFNANPLLRFDGYYILSDLIEIPNLRSRANRYLGYIFERYAFAREGAKPPHVAPGEPGWLVGYAIAAFLYRIFIVVAIFFWILTKFFIVGLVLCVFAAVGWVLVPLWKGVRYLFTSPQLRQVRGRAVAVSLGALALVLVFLSLVPMPLRSQAEGVVWIPEEALVRARTSGFVAGITAEPGARVEPGAALIELANPDLEAQIAVLEARVAELEALLVLDRTRNLVDAALRQEEVAFAKEQLARAREEASRLTLRSQTTGQFVVPRSVDLPGRYVRKGDFLAEVLDLQHVTVRAIVHQGDMDLVRQRLKGVDVRLSESLAEVVPATLRRVVPAASTQLPHAALGSGGGGEVPVDPRDPLGATAMQSTFTVELELAAEAVRVNGGGRAYVRFDFGTESLAFQWYRRLRQLFLERFNV